MLAVDGGNTKTIAVVADAGGHALGAGRGGCSDIYNAPTPADAIDAIVAAAAIASIPSAGVAAL